MCKIVLIWKNMKRNKELNNWKCPPSPRVVCRKYSETKSINCQFNPFFVTGFTAALIPSRRNKSSLQKSSECKSLVVWGTNLQSTVGEKFTRKELTMVILTPYTRGVIVGLLLSDGWLIISNSKNARLGFKQALSNSAYVWFVFNILSHYCSSSPCLTSGIRAGNRYYGLQFLTRLMLCKTELHSLFYPNKIKLVPHNIYELLTPVALAHWIAGDGNARPHGLILCTDSYSVEDVVKLMNVLIIKYRVECTIRVHRENQYRIYIREESMPLIRHIVKPHFSPSMLYKLKL